MLILINSSKTMTHVADRPGESQPALQAQAAQLSHALAQLSTKQLATLMHISPNLAQKTKQLIETWIHDPATTAALDAFQGDIFKGLRAKTFIQADRVYANQHLRILSGLYGILQPLDAIKPYRFEPSYAYAPFGHTNVYDFWGDLVSKQIPPKSDIIQLASQEFFRMLEPFIAKQRIITPQFMTKLPGQAASFVTVHAKVTRGAFARWLLLHRIHTKEGILGFNDLGYTYSPQGSTPSEPLFITHQPIKPTQLT